MAGSDGYKEFAEYVADHGGVFRFAEDHDFTAAIDDSYGDILLNAFSEFAVSAEELYGFFLAM